MDGYGYGGYGYLETPILFGNLSVSVSILK